MPRIVVGISGASGMPLAQHLLQALHAMPDVEVHLMVSAGAEAVLATELLTPQMYAVDGLKSVQACPNMPDGVLDISALTRFAHVVHNVAHIGAGPASGSWQHAGMVICPCSMATLACIATGAGHTLLHRSADVCLKERRPLVLVARETPLSAIHLQNMLTLSQAGACIMPPCPAFYGQPKSINDLLEHFTGRVLDQLGLAHNLGHRWQGNA